VTCGLAEETEKQNKTKKPEESHKTVKFHHHKAATKFGEFVDITVVVTSAKFGSKIFIGFSSPRGRKTHFPFRNETVYITVPCATGLA